MIPITLLAAGADAPPVPLPGFRTSAWFGERVREEWVGDGVRALANAPAAFDPKKPSRLVVHATPNGNTIEQTPGCGAADGLDWHFDIQHVAGQVRRLREVSPGENVVLVCVEADAQGRPGPDPEGCGRGAGVGAGGAEFSAPPCDSVVSHGR